MKKVKSVLENLLIIILVLLLVIGITNKVQLSYDNPYPDFFGFRSLTVLTGSMSPSIKPGDIVVIREVDKNGINVGDVVTYNKDNILITHRVNQIIKEANYTLFITKGDANNSVDSDAIGANQIMGKKIIKLPYAGYVIKFVNNNFVLFPLFIVLYVAIIITKEILKVKKITKTQ